jgi:flagellar biosynthesis protein FliQ
MIKHISHRIFITVFILIALHASPNGPLSARYTDAIQSLVDYGTFALHGTPRSAIDIVQVNNNFYSVIPPGIPIILAPLYFLHRTLMGVIGIPSVDEVYWAVFNILINICVVAPLVGLVAVLMYKTLSKFTDNVTKKLWLVFIFIFGSLVFFYSIYGIWSHTYTMPFIFIAFYLTINKGNSFLIGLCLGLAQLVDYIAIIPISLLIGFWAYTQFQDKTKSFIKELVLLLLAYSIFVAILLYYNHSVTGSMFQTPNSLFLQKINRDDSVHKSLFSLPSLESLWGLTFSPFRGVFLYFPMTFLFFMSLIKNDLNKNKIFLFSLILFTFVFIYNASYFAWSGDVCFGPRHLVVAIPYMIIPIVYCPLKYIKIFGTLSIFVNLAGVATVPSDNLFKNIAMFLYKGPFLQWLDYLYKVVLPHYYNVRISLMTPFFIYVATGFLIYFIWKPSIKQQDVLFKDRVA